MSNFITTAAGIGFGAGTDCVAADWCAVRGGVRLIK